jgi:hypothetical protein
MARRIGANWFETAVTFDDFVNAPHGYYSVGGAADVDLGAVSCTSYQSEPDAEGRTIPLYRGTYNPVIPAGALGAVVVLKIHDPVDVNDVLEYDPIDVCTDVATSVVITPASANVAIGKTRQFTANFYAADTLATTNHDAALWSTNAAGPLQGSINTDTGIFTAGSAIGGPYVVSVTAGLVGEVFRCVTRRQLHRLRNPHIIVSTSPVYRLGQLGFFIFIAFLELYSVYYTV